MVTKLLQVTTTYISGQFRVVPDLLYIILEVARICVYNSLSTTDISYSDKNSRLYSYQSFAYPCLAQKTFLHSVQSTNGYNFQNEFS